MFCKFPSLFLLGRKYPTAKVRLSRFPPPWRIVLEGPAASTNTCWIRIHSNVLRSFFWKWVLSLQVTLGWVILTWVMWKFTATFYNCKFCSTELKLDYSDNKILWLQDLWSLIGIEENLLTTCCWQEDTWPIPLPWQICQIWIIHLF